MFDSNSNTLDELSAEEMIPLIKEDGYHVLTSDEYISLTVKSENNNGAPEEKAEDKAAEKQEVAKTEEPAKKDTGKAKAADQKETEQTKTKEDAATPEKSKKKRLLTTH
ncbi:hypothetical protein CV093_11845 [Oceanobacillus sp. 143]|nr:hypothetical protein CV093_11845 [Oceanobacillus sp. 143]